MIALRRSIPKISSSSRALTPSSRSATRAQLQRSRPRGARRARVRAGRPRRARAAPRSGRAARRRCRSRTTSRWRSSGGYSAAIPAATSARPEWSRDERRQPAAAASAATIPNASGKIDGTTATSTSGSRWTRWRCSSGPVKSVPRRRERLELARGSRRSRRSPRARRARAAPRAAPARPCSRSACRSRGRSARRPRRTRSSRSALPSSGSRSFALPGFGGSRRASSSSAASASLARRGHELVDVDAGRHLVHASTWPTTSSSTRADVLRADVDGLGLRERLGAQRDELARCRASSTRARSRAP